MCDLARAYLSVASYSASLPQILDQPENDRWKQHKLLFVTPSVTNKVWWGCHQVCLDRIGPMADHRSCKVLQGVTLNVFTIFLSIWQVGKCQSAEWHLSENALLPNLFSYCLTEQIQQTPYSCPSLGKIYPYPAVYALIFGQEIWQIVIAPVLC